MKKNNKILIGITIFIALLIALLVISSMNSIGKLSELTYNEIKEKNNKKEDYILIVSRSDCSHCMEYKPKVEQVAKENKITVYYIDYDSENEKTQEKFLKEFKLDGSTPMTLFIKEGKEVSILNRLEGDVDKDKIIDRFKKMKFID